MGIGKWPEDSDDELSTNRKKNSNSSSKKPGFLERTLRKVTPSNLRQKLNKGKIERAGVAPTDDAGTGPVGQPTNPNDPAYKVAGKPNAFADTGPIGQPTNPNDPGRISR